MNEDQLTEVLRRVLSDGPSGFRAGETTLRVQRKLTTANGNKVAPFRLRQSKVFPTLTSALCAVLFTVGVLAVAVWRGGANPVAPASAQPEVDGAIATAHGFDLSFQVNRKIVPASLMVKNGVMLTTQIRRWGKPQTAQDGIYVVPAVTDPSVSAQLVLGTGAPGVSPSFSSEAAISQVMTGYLRQHGLSALSHNNSGMSITVTQFPAKLPATLSLFPSASRRVAPEQWRLVIVDIGEQGNQYVVRWGDVIAPDLNVPTFAAAVKSNLLKAGSKVVGTVSIPWSRQVGWDGYAIATFNAGGQKHLATVRAMLNGGDRWVMDRVEPSPPLKAEVLKSMPVYNADMGGSIPHGSGSYLLAGGLVESSKVTTVKLLYPDTTHTVSVHQGIFGDVRVFSGNGSQGPYRIIGYDITGKVVFQQ